ncbi:hypothetical protein LZ554_002209 [Drepanopeziza brunnea f. sp. 'monogermtubi']|nr:hypothetical protein LZ554_002209 [Drepanopeziza brunnea f. sp. 'monogermtubi']
MDRALDEIVAERQRGGGRSRGGRRPRNVRSERNDYPRDGVRKSTWEDSRNIDSEWVHDKFDNDTGRRPTRPDRRYTPDPVYDAVSSKLRVENLHYDLLEEDLEDLFNTIGPVMNLTLTYDRAGRSEGVAYVTYETASDAKKAIREFDGANAKGQPIRLIPVPSGPSSRRGPPPQSRSLFERMGAPKRSRSDSPIRHSDVRRPPPSSVDRYVPGGTRSRSRSPRPRRRDGRRPGARRERGERTGVVRGGGERLARDGRPKKTQEELDAEMEDYFGGGSKDNVDPGPAAAATTGDDIDMIE